MKNLLLLFLIVVIALFAYVRVGIQNHMARTPQTEKDIHMKTAVFASGCLWCTESDFEKIPGFLDVVSGYTGDSAANPTQSQRA